MRKLRVEAFLTLDGVMQAPGGPEEDNEGGFGFGGWLAPLWDEDLDRGQLEDTMGRPFDLLLGRRTYEIFAGYWPTAPDEARRQAAERRDEVRRVAEQPIAGLGSGGADRRRCSEGRRGSQGD